VSSHDITIAGYLVFLALAVALNVRAHLGSRPDRPGTRIPTVGQVFSRLMHTRTGRIAVIAWWAFIGFHLFSK
jgi:hypothetical protein